MNFKTHHRVLFEKWIKIINLDPPFKKKWTFLKYEQEKISGIEKSFQHFHCQIVVKPSSMYVDCRSFV